MFRFVGLPTSQFFSFGLTPAEDTKLPRKGVQAHYKYKCVLLFLASSTEC